MSSCMLQYNPASGTGILPCNTVCSVLCPISRTLGWRLSQPVLHADFVDFHGTVVPNCDPVIPFPDTWNQHKSASFGQVCQIWHHQSSAGRDYLAGNQRIKAHWGISMDIPRYFQKHMLLDYRFFIAMFDWSCLYIYSMSYSILIGFRSKIWFFFSLSEHFFSSVKVHESADSTWKTHSEHGGLRDFPYICYELKPAHGDVTGMMGIGWR